MEILKYALGIRFDARKFPEGDVMHHAFELLYSVLSYSELCDVRVHGGYPYEDEPYIYLVVLEAEEYKTVRRAFVLLDADSALKMFLTDELPFIEKNRLQSVHGMTAYGNYDYISYKLPNAPASVYDTVPSTTRTEMSGRGFNFLFAPDSFKGTISAQDAVRMLTLAARETHYRGCTVTPLPIADGGEGTMLAVYGMLGGELRTATVHDPLGRPIEAQYAIINGDTALIEMAQASGLTLLNPDERDARHTNSYGTGELIMAAIDSGYRKIIVGLGGSATNDGGIGCAAAMGVKFLNKFGGEVEPCGDGMIFIKDIDTSFVPAAVRETKFSVMCDVANPLTGLNGATMTFGEQKGASAVDMFELECGMKNLRRYYNNIAGYDICKKSGAGAAGGMGAMLMALFNAKLRSGIETMLDLVSFDEKIKTASLVVTGEGKVDKQTVTGGKAVAGIIKHARGKIPVAVLCGSITEDARKEMIKTGVLTSAHSFIDEKTAIENANELFYYAAANMFSVLNAGNGMKKKPLRIFTKKCGNQSM